MHHIIYPRTTTSRARGNSSDTRLGLVDLRPSFIPGEEKQQGGGGGRLNRDKPDKEMHSHNRDNRVDRGILCLSSDPTSSPTKSVTWRHSHWSQPPQEGRDRPRRLLTEAVFPLACFSVSKRRGGSDSDGDRGEHLSLSNIRSSRSGGKKKMCCPILPTRHTQSPPPPQINLPEVLWEKKKKKMEDEA